MDTSILVFSGRKQAGKTVSTNWLFGKALQRLCGAESFFINKSGELVFPAPFVPSAQEQTEEGWILDPVSSNDEIQEFLAKNVWPDVKVYNYADSLKRDVCIRILGLEWDQCYGTNDQKNAPTKLLWENMPIPPSYLEDEIKLIEHRKKQGFMSGREVMQYVGTKVFRSIYSPVWVEETVRRITRDKPKLAIIGDCRFPDEVLMVKEFGAKIIRFTRNPFKETDESESALDSDRFDWANFDFVIDNRELNIIEQNDMVEFILNQWSWL